MEAHFENALGQPGYPEIVPGVLKSDWYAVYTRANHEKRVRDQLEQRSFESFLPLYQSLRRWKDRRVRLDLPLFPGYLFARLPLSARVRLLEVPGVVRLIGFNGQPHPIAEAEIDFLRTGLSEGMKIEPHPYLKAGSRVRIKSGPLAGAEGVLIRKKNVHRVVLTIDVIARSATVEVDILNVERVP